VVTLRLFREIGSLVKSCTVLRVLVPDQLDTVLVVLYERHLTVRFLLLLQ
jgi:hypothetical protein